MFSYDDRMKAVLLYIKYDRGAAATIRVLGYPRRETLRQWIQERCPDIRTVSVAFRRLRYGGRIVVRWWRRHFLIVASFAIRYSLSRATSEMFTPVSALLTGHPSLAAWAIF